ncbi:amidohydrolase family protein [Ornithinibacillus sp. JPR2-1]|uniref:amidohydrolase family protein n=1 Tax=Ornithinibacillus sp. JPR2-1 TaxID=2094019 RepID=UPI0031DE877A
MKELRHYIAANGTIIDVENEVSFEGSIEICDGKISRIYRQNEALPDDISVVDVSGKYLIPGLIDMHCHIQERFAPHFLASGVTTVRNTAGNVFLLKNMIDAPFDVPTPRVYAADRMIDGTPGLWGPTSFGNLVTDDPEIARKEVRRQAEAGAKFIKVYGLIKKEVLQAVVEEAREFNLEVSCDLIHAKELNALEAAEIGVTWFEHASGFVQALYDGWHPTADQEKWRHIDWEKPDEARIKALCEEMLKHHVKLCPTLVLTDQVTQQPNPWYPKNKVTESLKKEGILIDHWEKNAEQEALLKEQIGILDLFTKTVAKTYADLGGTVVAGTDTPALIWTFPGMALHRELELFVEIGFSEIEALQAATIQAARSIQMEEMGVIKEGFIADLVVLDANPLIDIQHTKSIHHIIKGGKIYSQDEILSNVPSDEYMDKLLADFQIEWEKIESVQS